MKLLAAAGLALFLLAQPTKAGEPVDYARDVRPIFAGNCLKCHGPTKASGDLRLDSGAAILRGGNSGSAVIAGNSGKSRLFKAISGGTDDVVAMPPNEKNRLSAKQIALVKAWIDQGAKVPAAETVA